MPKIAFASLDGSAVVSSPQGSTGRVETRAVFDRGRDPIHLHLHRLTPGAAVRVTGAPTDHLFYVWQGDVTAGDARLGPGSSAIVEYGASLTVTGGDHGATLVEFNLKDRSDQDGAGGHVRLLPKERVPRFEGANPDGKRIDMALHADSRCPTCTAWLHETVWYDADVETVLHSHSEDEVIFVIGGSLRVGKKLYGPGTALAVAAGVKYDFFSGPGGLSFINFRGTAPTYTSADGSVVFNEAELWYTQIKGGKPAYLTVRSA